MAHCKDMGQPEEVLMQQRKGINFEKTREITVWLNLLKSAIINVLTYLKGAAE